MSNKVSFINKTVELNADLTFCQMEILERILKDAYLEAATSNDISGLEILKELGESMGIDAEIAIGDDQAQLEAVE